MGRSNLARAVRASMSIPLVFPPVDWESRRLVDGLVVDNLPIDVAKAFDAGVLVAIDIGSPPLEPSEYESALGVASRVNDLLTRRRHRDFAAEADVLVRPDLGTHSATDYSGFDELIERAYEATKAQVPAIRESLAKAGITDLSRRPQTPRGPRLEERRSVRSRSRARTVSPTAWSAVRSTSRSGRAISWSGACAPSIRSTPRACSSARGWSSSRPGTG